MMIERKIMLDSVISTEYRNNDIRNLDLKYYRYREKRKGEDYLQVTPATMASSHTKWITPIFWALDVRTHEQMLELANLIHQMVVFDPLLFNTDDQKFRVWQALDSRLEPTTLQQARSKREYFARLALDGI